MRLRTLALILTLALGLLVAPLPAQAEQAGQVHRIGILSPGRPLPPGSPSAFRQGLRDLGWVEGQNLIIEGRFAEGRYERLPTLAAELVRLEVAVIVAWSTPGAIAAKKATAEIPIVMAGATAPVEYGLIASYGRPGGNVTGLTNNPGLDFADKQLQLLKEAAPQISRLAWLWNGSLPMRSEEGFAKWSKTRESAAQSLGIALFFVKVRNAAGMPAAFARITGERANALMVNPTSLNIAGRKQIVDFAITQRLPTMFGEKRAVVAGGLMSYWTDWSDLSRRAATYVDKILKGANPADLPVEQPTKFEFLINMKTAKALDLTIPPSVLVRADNVIE